MNFNSLWFSSCFSFFSLTFLYRLSRRIQNVQKLSFIFFAFYTYHNYIHILPTLVGCTRDCVLLLIAICWMHTSDCGFLLQRTLGILLHSVWVTLQDYAESDFGDFWDGLLWLLLSLLAFDIFGWVAHCYYFVSLLILVSSSADVQ